MKCLQFENTNEQHAARIARECSQSYTCMIHSLHVRCGSRKLSSAGDQKFVIKDASNYRQDLWNFFRMKTHYLLFITTISVTAIMVIANDEVVNDCLVLPFISSFDEVRAETNGKGTTLYLKFKVDYNYTVEVSNLTLTKQRLKSNPDTKVRIFPQMRDRRITYTVASYRDPRNNKSLEHFYFTKSDAYREARKVYRRLNLATNAALINTVAPPCSPVYIYQFDLIMRAAELDSKDKQLQAFQHRKFHKFVSCIKTYMVDVKSKPVEPLIASSENYTFIDGVLKMNSVVAGGHSNGRIVMASGDGRLIVVSADNAALKGEKKTMWQRITSRPNADPAKAKVPILEQGATCSRLLEEVKLDRSSSYDIKSFKPPRTLTRGIDPDHILVAEALDGQFLRLHYTDRKNNNTRVRGKWRARGVFTMKEFFKEKKGVFDVSSMAIFQNKGKHWIHAIFRNHEITSHLFYINSELGANYTAPRDRLMRIDKREMAEPDDLTYWTTCELIVSFYGFMYTTHDYKTNIFKQPSMWHILDEKLFHYPIEAVQADGDEFYFFFKATTVYKMHADSSAGCKSIKFTKKTRLHVSQFYGHPATHFHTESRFYSSKIGDWSPSWNTFEWPGAEREMDEAAEQQPGDSGDSLGPGGQDGTSIWLFMGIALIVLVVFVVGFMVYNYFNRQVRHPSKRRRRLQPSRQISRKLPSNQSSSHTRGQSSSSRRRRNQGRSQGPGRRQQLRQQRGMASGRGSSTPSRQASSFQPSGSRR